MTRKNAKKRAARARQQKHGGSYAAHRRQVEAEAAAAPTVPIPFPLRTLDQLREYVKPFAISDDEGCVLTITAGRPAPVSGLVLRRWDLAQSGSVKREVGSSLNGMHAQTLRFGLDYLVGRRSVVSGASGREDASTLQELREDLQPNDFLMYPEGSAACWVLRGWADGVEFVRWTVSRARDLSEPHVIRLRGPAADVIRSEALRLLPLPTGRTTVEPHLLKRLHACVQASIGYVQMVFEDDSELTGYVLSTGSGRSRESNPRGYSGTALIRLDDGRAWWVDLLDVLHVEAVRPPRQRSV